MSDRIINPLGGATPAAKPAKAEGAGDLIKIIRPGLETRGESTRRQIQGQVIRSDQNGRATIRTNEGDIEIRIEARDAAKYKEGQAVRIEISRQPDGQQQATIKAQAQQAQQAQQQQTTQLPPRGDIRDEVRITTNPTDKPAPQNVQTYSVPKAQAAVQNALTTAILAREQPVLRIVPLTQPQLNTILKTSGTAQPVTIQPTLTALPNTATSLQNTVLPTAPNTVNTLQTSSVLTPPPAITPQGVFAPTTPNTLNNVLLPQPQNSGVTVPPINTPAPLTSTVSEPLGLPGQVKIMNVQTPSSYVPNTTQANPQVIEARVVGFNQQNFPLLSVQHGPNVKSDVFFMIPSVIKGLEMGSVIQFTLTNTQQTTASVGVPTTTIASSSATASAPLSPWQGWQWPSLNALGAPLTPVEQISINVTVPPMPVLPNPAASSAQITSTMMFFMAALKSGDVSSWFGERGSEALRRIGRGGALEQLQQDMNNTRSVSERAAPTEWRAMPIPLYDPNNGLSRVNLYYRHENDEDGNVSENMEKTRFLFHLNLNRMGEVQLDGLVMNSRKTLDMRLLTEKPISKSMQRQILGKFSTALELADFSGTISFQGGTEHLISVPTPSTTHYGTDA